jgi:hypothetical protein
MRYAIFGALILGLELLGASIASAAMPANGNAVVKADSSRDVIQVWGGCGGIRATRMAPSLSQGCCGWSHLAQPRASTAE